MSDRDTPNPPAPSTPNITPASPSPVSKGHRSKSWGGGDGPRY